jgi:predicted amidohydrolase YtcJ
MSADLILTASSVITMDENNPRVNAVAVDTTSGTIVAAGSLADCQAAAPGVTPTDLGTAVLMPGFIEAHSHPLVSGICTESPSYWISPSMGYTTFAQVQDFWRSLDSSLPAGQPVLCWGLDRLNQGAPELTNTDLDAFFATRPAVIFDISGHEAYFNSVIITNNGWPGGKPPADPPASRFGRNPDGTSNGRAYETAAVVAATGSVQKEAIPDPLMSVARWFRTLAQVGVTTTSENTYATNLLPAYEALTSAPNTPLRVGLYHAASDPSYLSAFTSSIPESRLWKAGVKFWSDGTTFIGTLAASFPFLDNATTQAAGIPLGPGAEADLNYTRAALDALLDPIAGTGLQVAIHAHGDVAIDTVLDAYASVLSRHNMLGTDHRWRIEHWSAGRFDQFQRAVDLGVCTPMASYQFELLGDLLDGTLFPSDIGSQWVAAADAIKAGAVISFHSDSPVAPVNPLLTIQVMVSRRTPAGNLHGANQAISLDDALKAYTINAAHHMHREQDLGSITVGKLADFVVLSADPYAVDPETLSSAVKVLGTWTGGRKVDIDAFMSDMQSVDPVDHPVLISHAQQHTSC